MAVESKSNRTVASEVQERMAPDIGLQTPNTDVFIGLFPECQPDYRLCDTLKITIVFLLKIIIKYATLGIMETCAKKEKVKQKQKQYVNITYEPLQ